MFLKIVYVYCDFKLEDCDPGPHCGEVCRSRSVAEAREDAIRDGWKFFKGKAACPCCAQSLSEPQGESQ